MATETILVVDDEDHIREVIKAALSDRYAVEEATNGVEGVIAARKHRPDLIILDWMMPTLDGIGVLEKLKDDPNLASVPILMLTAKGTTQDLVSSLKHGADDYLKKPFDLKEMVARVEALLRRSKLAGGHSAIDVETGLPKEEGIQQELDELTRSGVKKAIGVMVPIGIELLEPESRFTLLSYLKNLSLQTMHKFTNQRVFAGLMTDQSLVLIFPTDDLSLVAKELMDQINTLAGAGGTLLDQVKIKTIFLDPKEPAPFRLDQLKAQVYRELTMVSNFRRHECRIQSR